MELLNGPKMNYARLDVDTRKLLTMHRGFSTNSNVDRLYISGKNGGRGLISVRFAIEHEKRSLSFYVHNSADVLMKLVARSFVQFQEDSKHYKQSVISEHLSLLKDKPLHGQFL